VLERRAGRHRWVKVASVPAAAVRHGHFKASVAVRGHGRWRAVAVYRGAGRAGRPATSQATTYFTA
jgi:hypothetical protein